MLRSLLIPADLSPASERIVERAALLPLAGDARIALLHVVSSRFPRAARLRAEDDARKALERLAKRLARKLAKGRSVQPLVKLGSAAAEIAKHARSSKAELIVMGRGRGRPLDSFVGSTAERVVRQARLPVLVVRLPPRGPYRKPVIALDLDRAAPAVLDVAPRVLPPPRPQLTVVHAFDIPFENAIYPSLSPDEGDEYRAYYRQKALGEIGRLLAAAQARNEHGAGPEDGARWIAHVRSGSPRTVIEREVRKLKADLLLLGTHGYSGMAQAWLGTVAGDVLRSVPCDVLVVPP